MSADVKPGYTQTEIGVIPDDWSVCELGDLAPYVTSGSRGWAEYYSDRGDPFIRITNLSRSTIYIDQTDLKFVKIPNGDSEGQRTALIDGDLLISITADIGIIGYVDSSLSKPAYINQHIALVRFKDQGVDSKYLSYFLAGEVTQRLFRSSTDQGAKAGMNLAGIRSIKAALPPMAEQRAIAAALSEMDNLLSSLDQLIAKKRNIQQAAMQQLLTGQRRLPGFTGEWEVKRLGDLATFMKGQGLSKNDLVVGGIRPCIHYGELFTHYSVTIQEVTSRTNNKLPGFLSKENDVLMPTSDVTPRGLAKASCITVSDVLLGGDILVIRPNLNSINGSFLSYVIRHNEDQVLKLVSGSTVFHLYAADMKQFEFMKPPIEEQDAIATTLSDIDSELAALETRRDKAHQLKQGMMQELLTGRIRLANGSL